MALMSFARCNPCILGYLELDADMLSVVCCLTSCLPHFVVDDLVNLIET